MKIMVTSFKRSHTCTATLSRKWRLRSTGAVSDGEEVPHIQGQRNPSKTGGWSGCEETPTSKGKGWRSSIQSAKTRPGADSGSDHELLIAKFRLKLKKVGKTTRPFRYDLNQIPYDYTVEMRNRFKGLDLIYRVPDELWVEVHDIAQEAGINTIPKKKKCKKAKWLSEETLQVAEKRRDERKKRKGKIYPVECRVPKNSKER